MEPRDSSHQEPSIKRLQKEPEKIYVKTKVKVERKYLVSVVQDS